MNAVIGNPLTHSLSPILHNEIYRQLGIESRLIKDEDADIKKLVGRIIERPYELTAVTIPYKQMVMRCLDEIDCEAKKIGAVNTVINKNGKLVGYNTDIVGIRKAFAGVVLSDKNVLVLGAGGAARPVAYFVSQCGGKAFYCSRTLARSKELACEFGGKAIKDGDLSQISFDVIINATPVGMYPKIDEMPIKSEILSPQQTVFDVVYNPPQTKLLRIAKDVGACVISGLDMFIYQGIAQVELWQNKKLRIDFGEIKHRLVEQLNNQNI